MCACACVYLGTRALSLIVCHLPPQYRTNDITTLGSKYRGIRKDPCVPFYTYTTLIFIMKYNIFMNFYIYVSHTHTKAIFGDPEESVQVSVTHVTLLFQ